MTRLAHEFSRCPICSTMWPRRTFRFKPLYLIRPPPHALLLEGFVKASLFSSSVSRIANSTKCEEHESVLTSLCWTFVVRRIGNHPVFGTRLHAAHGGPLRPLPQARRRLSRGVGLRVAKVRCSAALVDPKGWRHLAPGLAIGRECAWDRRFVGGEIAGNCYRNRIP